MCGQTEVHGSYQKSAISLSLRDTIEKRKTHSLGKNRAVKLVLHEW